MLSRFVALPLPEPVPDSTLGDSDGAVNEIVMLGLTKIAPEPVPLASELRRASLAERKRRKAGRVEPDKEDPSSDGWSETLRPGDRGDDASEEPTLPLSTPRLACDPVRKMRVLRLSFCANINSFCA
jgi:hypothetical protein